jgi:hypothetical protein
MSEIEPDSEASNQKLRSERPVRMAALPISAGMTRRALRIVCMRIHDVEGVLTVEVDRADASIRVTGTMDIAELVAAIGATESEVA